MVNNCDDHLNRNHEPNDQNNRSIVIKIVKITLGITLVIVISVVVIKFIIN